MATDAGHGCTHHCTVPMTSWVRASVHRRWCPRHVAFTSKHQPYTVNYPLLSLSPRTQPATAPRTVRCSKTSNNGTALIQAGQKCSKTHLLRSTTAAEATWGPACLYCTPHAAAVQLGAARAPSRPLFVILGSKSSRRTSVNASRHTPRQRAAEGGTPPTAATVEACPPAPDLRLLTCTPVSEDVCGNDGRTPGDAFRSRRVEGCPYGPPE